ncbi:MAG: gluconokinase [Anaerolineales bacterium]
MEYYIGLDLGTSRCKAVALSTVGEVLGKASVSYGLSRPNPGWVEQDPAQVWEGAQSCLEQLTDQRPGGVAAGLCLSGAMHSLFPVNKRGKPLSAAMTWADCRAQAQSERLRRQFDAGSMIQRTGCPLQPQYFPARLNWWRENYPEIFQQASYFVGLKDWILYRLTGIWAIDLGMASTTGLLDIHRLEWDSQALDVAGVSAERLPELLAPSQPTANLETSVAKKVGLPATLPVIAGSDDGGLANLGSGAVRPQAVIISVGTSGAVRVIKDRPAPDPSGKTWCYYLENSTWFAGGAINNGGLALEWVKKRFYSEQPDPKSYQKIMLEVSNVSPGAGGVMWLPYFTGERSPLWNTQLSATLTGLSLATERGHIARAVLEAVAFTIADVWQALELEQPCRTPAKLTGGITQSPYWAQILADVLGAPLQLRKNADASATGAAILAALALEDVTQDLKTTFKKGIDSRFPSLIPGDQALIQPSMENHAVYRELHTRFKNLRQRLIVDESYT